MACVHTGARLFLSEYGGVAICDAHAIGHSAVFRISGELIYGEKYDPKTMYAVSNTGDGWFGRRDPISTLVVDRPQLTLPYAEDEDPRWPESWNARLRPAV